MKKLTLAWLLCSVAACGQNPWTLQECVRYAQAHNIPLQQQSLNVQSQQLNASQAKGAMLPTLNAGGSHMYNVGKTIDRFTNTFANAQVLSQNLFVSANLVVWNGFSVYNNMRAAHFNYLSSLEQQKQQEYDLALNVAGAYINAVFTDELLIIAIAQRAQSEEQLERTKKMVAAGALAKSSEYEVAAQLANEEVNVVTAGNNYQLALLALRQLMNLDSVSDFRIQKPDAQVEEHKLLESDPDATFQVALKNQPVIKSGEYAVSSAEKAVQAGRGRYFPVLSAGATWGTGTSGLAREVLGVVITGSQVAGVTAGGEPVYLPVTEVQTRQTPLATQFRDNINRSFGFTLSFPILNGFQTRTSVKNAQLNALNARLGLDLQKQNLYKAIAQAHADARAALKKFRANEQSVLAASEAFRYAQEKFNAGASSAFDFSNAKNRLIMAESNLVQAKYDYIFKVKVLDFYKGKQLD